MDIEHRMRDINLTSILVAIVFLTSRQCANGLTCYICQSTSPSSSCISNPDTSSTCNAKYCTIYRRELAEPEGILTAFHRACEDTPMYLNTEVCTPYAKTYYRACESDLCNIGDGRTEVTTKNALQSVSGDGIVVPGVGVGNIAPSIHAGSFFALLLILVAYAMAMYYE